MVVLVIGVPDSGKSKRAEDIAVSLSGGGKKIYIATMVPFGDEGAARVEKHRKLRAGKGFETMECPRNIGGIQGAEGCTCLLECMSNLVGNEMYAEDNGKLDDEELTKLVVAEIKSLMEKAANTVIVTNSFPGDGEGYDDETRRYVQLMDMVNDRLRKMADEIYEYVKGEWVVENT